MDEDLKDSLRDTARAMPFVALAMVGLTVAYIGLYYVVHGSWPW